MDKVKLFYQTYIDGKKTHLTALALGALNAAVALGWISPDHLTQINLVLGAFGLSALRSAINKV